MLKNSRHHSKREESLRIVNKSVLFTIFVTTIVRTVQFTTLAEGATTFFANNRFTEDGVQWCEEELPRYEILGEAKWLEHHRYSIEARVGANLFDDPLWEYEGDDRIQKLIERSKYYVELEIAESQKEAKTGKIDPTPADVIKESEKISKIPNGVRNIFIWYGQELISEDELLNAIQYLIDTEILKTKLSSM